MNTYTSLAKSIINEQEKIVGPLSWAEAKKVNGLSFHERDVTIKGDGKKVLENLVNQYSNLFGKASIEVCKEAVKNELNKLQKEEIPDNLR